MSSGTGYLLALTADQAERRKALGVTGKRLGLELIAFDQTPAALSWLMGHDPKLVVLDARVPKAEQLGLKLRSKKSLTQLPIISLSEEMSDVFTANSYAAGADDVIPVDAAAQLAQRLRTLPDVGGQRRDASRGIAVVADANRGRCDLLTRVLVAAGYEVKSAIDERSLQFYQRQHGPKLFVVNSELTDVRQAIQSSRRSGDDVAWVVTASRRELDSLTHALFDAPRVVVTGANAPPSDALFLANELGYDGQTSRRKGNRKLLGTVVRFREAGSDEEDFGFTYNVSERGVYVRTIAPPQYDEVWLELRPPKAKHWVRLLGRVAWRHSFNPGVDGLSPPGFGVELLAGLGQDLESFAECFRAFADTAPRGAGRSTFVPVRRASVGLMVPRKPPRAGAKASPGAGEAPPSSQATEVRDSWLSSDELESIPPSEAAEVRDSDWDEVEASPRRADGVNDEPVQKAASDAVNEDEAAESGSQEPAEALASAPDGRRAAEGAAMPASSRPDDEEGDQKATREDSGAPEGEDEPGEEQEAADDEEEDDADDEEEDAADDEEEDAADDEEESGDEDEDAIDEDARPAVFDRAGLEARGHQAPRRSGLSTFKLLLVAGVTAGITAAVYTASRSEGGESLSAKPPASSVQASSTPARPQGSTTASPAPDETSKPAPSASSQGSQAPATVPTEPTFDAATLARDQGALRVTASGQASVFVLGVNRGNVGDWITVKCGMQFVRLGRGDPPSWVSQGRTVVIPCQTTTTANFEIDE